VVTVDAPEIQNWGFSGFTITTTNGTLVSYNQNGNQASFTMPDSNVIVMVNYQFNGKGPAGGLAVPAYNPLFASAIAVATLSIGLLRQRRRRI
jgi:hypothetical protein